MNLAFITNLFILYCFESLKKYLIWFHCQNDCIAVWWKAFWNEMQLFHIIKSYGNFVQWKKTIFPSKFPLKRFALCSIVYFMRLPVIFSVFRVQIMYKAVHTHKIQNGKINKSHEWFIVPPEKFEFSNTTFCYWSIKRKYFSISRVFPSLFLHDNYKQFVFATNVCINERIKFIKNLIQSLESKQKSYFIKLINRELMALGVSLDKHWNIY